LHEAKRKLKKMIVCNLTGNKKFSFIVQRKTNEIITAIIIRGNQLFHSDVLFTNKLHFLPLHFELFPSQTFTFSWEMEYDY
jgi:hypothetical protein